MRGLLLPPMTILKQPSMLVLPRISFSEGQRILLNQSGSEVRAVLTRIVAATDAFAQYEFRLIDTGQPIMSSARRPGATDAELFEYDP